MEKKLYYRNTTIEVKPRDKFRVIKEYAQFNVGDIVYYRHFDTFAYFADNEELSYMGRTGCLNYNDKSFEDEVEPYTPPTPLPEYHIGKQYRVTECEFSPHHVGRIGFLRKIDHDSCPYGIEWVDKDSGLSDCYASKIEPVETPLIENLEPEGGEKQMAEFRDGDTIRMLDSCSSGCEIGEKYTIKVDSRGELATLINGNRICNHKNLWELVSHANENMSDTKYRELTEFQKENWTPDTQALYRAGIISANGEIESNIAFSNALLRLNIKPLAKQATEDIAKAEAEAEIAKKVK